MNESTASEGILVPDSSNTISQKNEKSSLNASIIEIIENQINFDSKIKKVEESEGTTVMLEPKIPNFTEYSRYNFNVPKFLNYSFNNVCKNYFTSAQRWKGYVIEKNDKTFTAQLDDLINPSTHEIAEFDIKDAIDDLDLLKVGAVFYWSIGYAYINGSTEKKSLIRFQRLIKWTNDEYDKAADRADDLFLNLNWDDAD